MKTYSILFAEDVPHYGTAEITAANHEEAIVAAKSMERELTAPDWDNAVCCRIVHVEDEDGNIVAQDIVLDGFFLRHTQNIDARLCDAAPRLLDALTKIAAMHLWGEPITDDHLKSELLDVGEYDLELDQFEPSADTESAYLRDAVEIARAALAEMRGAPTATAAADPQAEGTNP